MVIHTFSTALANSFYMIGSLTSNNIEINVCKFFDKKFKRWNTQWRYTIILIIFTYLVSILFLCKSLHGTGCSCISCTNMGMKR